MFCAQRSLPSYRHLLAALVLLGLATVAAAKRSDGHIDDYLEGVAAFRDSQFEAALQAFQRAEAVGHADPNLTFNLALTFYRLERYAEAEAQLEALRSEPDFEAVAEYQMGLIAVRQGRVDEGLAHFRHAADTAPNPAIRQRAEAAMARLIRSAPPERNRTLYALISAGFDSNPALINDNFEALRNNEESSYGDLLTQGRWPLRSSRRTETDAVVDFFLREYVGVDELGQSTLQARLTHLLKDEIWQTTLIVGGETIWQDRNWLQHAFNTEVQRSRRVGQSSLQLRGQLSVIDSSERFAQLNGWRLRSAARWRQPVDRYQVLGEYQFEWNDRSDLQLGRQFVSQSPLRHQLLAELRHGALDRVLWDWKLRYRFSHFQDPHRLLDSLGLLQTVTRQDHLWSLSAQARRRVNSRFNGVVGYRFDRNDSTLTVYEYNRHTLMFGMEWFQ